MGGLANNLSDISGYVQDIYLRNNWSHSAAQRLLTSLTHSMTGLYGDNTSKRPERGCSCFSDIHFANCTQVSIVISFLECVCVCVRSNAYPLHYYALRVPRKVDRWR